MRKGAYSDLVDTQHRHDGASRLLADGVDIRTIQLMLGHLEGKAVGE